MKKLALLLALAAILLPAYDGGASDERTLNGEYVWNRGSEGDLEAVFTATGEGAWDVDFHFQFRGQKHVYSGTAEGSLDDGPLEGKVRNESKKRTFTFEGESKDGTFRGDHAEIGRNGVIDTGTLMLSHAASADAV